MMRVTTLLIIAWAFTTTAQAQRIGLGLKGGLLAASTDAAHVRTGIIPGATAGIYLPYHAGARFEIQPELLLTVCGARYTFPNERTFTDRTYYVQVPLQFKLFFGNELNLQGGVQMGKRLKATRDGSEGPTDVSEKYRTMDLGLTIGIGLDLTSGFDLTARYYSGMTPVLLNDDALFPKNRSIQITAGYRLLHFREINTTYRRR